MLAITVSATATKKKRNCGIALAYFWYRSKRNANNLELLMIVTKNLFNQTNWLNRKHRGAESALQTMLSSHLNRKNFQVIAISARLDGSLWMQSKINK